MFKNVNEATKAATKAWQSTTFSQDAIGIYVDALNYIKTQVDETAYEKLSGQIHGDATTEKKPESPVRIHTAVEKISTATAALPPDAHAAWTAWSKNREALYLRHTQNFFPQPDPTLPLPSAPLLRQPEVRVPSAPELSLLKKTR